MVTPNAPIVVTAGRAAAGARDRGSRRARRGVADPGAQPPPQNEDWSNVSHINGTPVPVGERGQYLYKFRKNEITVNPFGPFFGYYDAAAAHAVSQNVAIAGSLTGWDYSNSEHTGYQLTASVPIYLRRTFSGPFLEPGIVIRESTTSYDNYCYDASGADYSCADGDTHRWAGPEMLFGWQSTFDSGLNRAVGVRRRASTWRRTYDDGSDDTDVNGYFRVGYAF